MKRLSFFFAFSFATFFALTPSSHAWTLREIYNSVYEFLTTEYEEPEEEEPKDNIDALLDIYYFLRDSLYSFYERRTAHTEEVTPQLATPISIEHFEAYYQAFFEHKPVYITYNQESQSIFLHTDLKEWIEFLNVNPEAFIAALNKYLLSERYRNFPHRGRIDQFHYLKPASRLHSLHLSGFPFTDDSLLVLLTTVCECPDIVNLYLSDIPFSENQCALLKRFMLAATHTQSLHLNNCNLTGAKLTAIISALKPNDLYDTETNCTLTLQSRLQHLSLNDNNIRYSEVSLITNALRHNQNLRTLSLENNQLSLLGSCEVANVFLKHPKLTLLRIKGNFSPERGETKADNIQNFKIWLQTREAHTCAKPRCKKGIHYND